MTKGRRPGQRIGLIKSALIFGSLLSSLLGARAAAQKDAAENSVASSSGQPIVIVRVVPGPVVVNGGVSQQPFVANNNAQVNNNAQANNNPQPQQHSAPVARSSSSR